jgi:hypothetical protein
MSYTMTGVITGSTVSGLTTPTYTLTADTAVDDNSRASIVSALGGTQTGVAVHSVSSPFMVIVSRPRTLRTLGKANLNGLISNVGRNSYRVLTRKGVLPLAGQPNQIALARIDFEVPAGSDSADLPSLKALSSFVGGFLNTNASGIADLFANAVL